MPAQDDYDVERRDIAVATDAPGEHRNPWLMVSVNKLPLEVRASAG